MEGDPAKAELRFINETLKRRFVCTAGSTSLQGAGTDSIDGHGILSGGDLGISVDTCNDVKAFTSPQKLQNKQM